MNIPLDVIKIVASYLVKPKMKLLDWVLLDNLDWEILSQNPNAINLLEQNMDKINWNEILINPNAIHLLEQNIKKINWKWLSENQNIFEIEQKQLKIDIEEHARIIDRIIHY